MFTLYHDQVRLPCTGIRCVHLVPGSGAFTLYRDRVCLPCTGIRCVYLVPGSGVFILYRDQVCLPCTGIGYVYPVLGSGVFTLYQNQVCLPCTWIRCVYLGPRLPRKDEEDLSKVIYDYTCITFSSQLYQWILTSRGSYFRGGGWESSLKELMNQMSYPGFPAEPGDLNFICPSPEIAWNLIQKVSKPGQNKKFKRKPG